MKIGLIRETKTPVDNRVALDPAQVAELNRLYPQHRIVVQSSEVRAYSDDDYIAAGVQVVDDLADYDILFGIKEARIDSLIPGKHYFFFGHIAKMQEYNRPLLQAFLKKGITFSDYEYLVDDNNVRVCAFGWWAGVVGVYYTLRGYGLKYGLYELPKPDLKFTLDKLIENLKAVKLPSVKILLTGAGRVSHGAQHVLDSIGAVKMEEKDFLGAENVGTLSYCVCDVDRLVRRRDGSSFSWTDFTKNAREYESDFHKWAAASDVLICAHFWGPEAPVYLTEEDLRAADLRIKMIGDVTCDIKGSIKSTVKPATHAEPYYDYNPQTEQTEPAFSSEGNISVMAVDTCPNALPMDTSSFFGEMLVKHVFTPLLEGISSKVIDGSTIVKEGRLTEKFAYLDSFSKGE